MMEESMTGIVVHFHHNKGYGFIKPDDDGEDLFVHHSKIQSDGYLSLHEGRKVKFLVVDKNDWKQAVSVIASDGSNVDRNCNHDGYGGYRNGGGGGCECFNCGGFRHFARDCSVTSSDRGGGSGGGGACYNCGGSGHLARDCNRGRGGSATSSRGGGCSNCGEPGHLARDYTADCSSGHGYSRSGGDGGYRSSGGGGGGGGSGGCYQCGEPGYFARECPTKS